MDFNIKTFHILTSCIFIINLLIIAFSCDNPAILCAEFLLLFFAFYLSRSLVRVKKGISYFIPLASLTIMINVIFVQQGNTVLFTFFNREFTLEAILYSLILSFKLLLVILLFMLLEIMIDSDKAVSYFSSKMTKSTLLMMISMKLFPGMKVRLKNIEEVYERRGVDFENKSIKAKAKSYLPVLSILLESSLEASFDISEAAYVRGFLSTKRSVYDRQKFGINDRILTSLSIIVLSLYGIYQFSGKLKYDVYSAPVRSMIFTTGSILFISAMVFLGITILIFSKEKNYEAYRN